MKLEKFLLTTSNEYNLHKQTQIDGLSAKQLVKILNKLQLIEPQSRFIVKIWSDGGYLIEELDYWQDGEHHLGHRDRLILSGEGVR